VTGSIDADGSTCTVTDAGDPDAAVPTCTTELTAPVPLVPADRAPAERPPAVSDDSVTDVVCSAGHTGAASGPTDVSSAASGPCGCADAWTGTDASSPVAASAGDGNAATPTVDNRPVNNVTETADRTQRLPDKRIPKPPCTK
jgi:hypothetical protein